MIVETTESKTDDKQLPSSTESPTFDAVAADAALTDAELATAVDDAQSEAAAAEALAVGAEQRATAADETFQSSPSADSHTNAAVQRQLAINAGAQARQLAARSEALTAQLTLRRKAARLQELRPAAARNQFLARAFDDVHALVLQVQVQIAQASQRLLVALDAQGAAAREAYDLVAHLEARGLTVELGADANRLTPVTVTDLNDHLRARLAAAFPTRRVRTAHGFGEGPERVGVQVHRYEDGSIFATFSAAELFALGDARFNPDEAQ